MKASANMEAPAVKPRAFVALRIHPDEVTEARILADYGFAQVAAWGVLGERDRASIWQSWANNHWSRTPEWDAIRARRSNDA